MSQYARDTTVGVSQSKAEIEHILQRYGATSFFHGWNEVEAMIAFKIANRHVKIVLPMPNRNSEEFTHHSRGRRTPEAAFKEWEQVRGMGCTAD